MTDDFRVRLDQTCGAPVALREEAAEFVDEFVRVEADRFRVVADERAREDAARPLREIVALEPDPEIRADLGYRREGFDADAAPLTFAAQPGAEGVSFRHENSPQQQVLRRAPAATIGRIPVSRHDTRQPDL
jgi:hypothetical protein